MLSFSWLGNPRAPKLISYGNFYLHTGVLVALGFLAGLTVTVRLARRSGLNAELMTNLAVYVALAGMLGAKILMIVFDWNRFMANPRQIFSLDTIRRQPLVFQGGLILALVTAYFYMRHQGLPLLAASDAFAPGSFGPFHRTSWMPGGELLLGQCVPPAVGHHVSQSRCVCPYRSAA